MFVEHTLQYTAVLCLEVIVCVRCHSDPPISIVDKDIEL